MTFAHTFGFGNGEGEGVVDTITITMWNSFSIERCLQLLQTKFMRRWNTWDVRTRSHGETLVLYLSGFAQVVTVKHLYYTYLGSHKESPRQTVSHGMMFSVFYSSSE